METGKSINVRLFKDRGLEGTTPKAEPKQLSDFRLALEDEIGSGDSTVDDSVLNVLGNVGRTDEQDINRRVPTGESKRALPRHLRPKPGVLEQRDGRLSQPTLRRNSDR